MWPFHCPVKSFSISANSTVLKETPGRKEITLLLLHILVTFDWLIEVWKLHILCCSATDFPKDWSWRSHTGKNYTLSEKVRGQWWEEKYAKLSNFSDHVAPYQTLHVFTPVEVTSGSIAYWKTLETDAILTPSRTQMYQRSKTQLQPSRRTFRSFPISANPVL